MEQQMYEVVHPGRIQPEVLTLQDEHRSARVYGGDQTACTTSLVVRLFADTVFLHFPLDPRVMEAVDLAGFGLLCRAGLTHVDHHLITALVERWRPETHTFHFHSGEATITLGDVAVLWGLRIDGEPITFGAAHARRATWIDMCDRLLGFRPDFDVIVGNKMKKHVVEAQIGQHLPIDAPVEAIHQRARCVILLLIGGLLFSDLSGNLVPLRYLYLLEDLEACGRLSWGSAVLGYLYRCLCDATSPTRREICGPTLLLQVHFIYINSKYFN